MKCEHFDKCDMKELPDDEIPDCIFNNGEGNCAIDYDVNMDTVAEVITEGKRNDA